MTCRVENHSYLAQKLPPIPAKRADFTTACKALSYITGIPSGRFSLLPGFGIQTILVGLDFPVSFNSLASSRRAAGDKLLNPSTPAVFFPWLS